MNLCREPRGVTVPSPTLNLSFVTITAKFLAQPNPSGSLEPCAWGLGSLYCPSGRGRPGVPSCLPLVGPRGPCQAGLLLSPCLHPQAHPVEASPSKACPWPGVPPHPAFPGRSGDSSVGRRGLDCSCVSAVCSRHVGDAAELSVCWAGLGWASARRASGYIRSPLCTFARLGPACGPATSVACSPLQRGPAAGMGGAGKPWACKWQCPPTWGSGPSDSPGSKQR